MSSHSRATADYCRMRRTMRDCVADAPPTDSQRAAIRSGRLRGTVG